MPAHVLWTVIGSAAVTVFGVGCWLAVDHPWLGAALIAAAVGGSCVGIAWMDR